MALMSFMVVIEAIRNLIRPSTLAIRLTANIIAGHLLIALLGNQFVEAQLSTFIPIYITQITLTTLELAVAVIQSYVFAVLLALYLSESAKH
jgi:F-type H+-transporting ATPase subunit a